MEHPVAVTQASLLWLIPALPLAGFAVNALLGVRLQKAFGKWIVHTVAIASVAASFAVALVFLSEMLGLDAGHRHLQETLWNLFTAGRLSVDLAFALDPLSMTLVLVITGIGSLIHLFSVGYMAEDPAYWRFFCYLNLFVFAMLLLVMGDNFAVMFFGWEGVGLASYLLIAFWYSDPEKAKAGMKAFVVNRIGDFGFLLGMLLLFWALGGAWAPRPGIRAVEYQPASELRPLDPAIGAADADALAPRVAGVKVGPTLSFRELRDELTVEETGVKERLLHTTLFGMPVLALSAILLFVGAMGKSAQLPLYVWLPDAMAGPTPVSALIHAATMVTAGVYMVARLSFLFALSPSAMGWVALVGALSAAFAASIGFFQYDIKKVLAYSTISQLGFMFVGVGVGSYWAGTYHLVTHAFFKATLFLAAGSVILGCHHEQDMRRMGGLAKHMPLTRYTYLVACIAIAGFPVANGFYSKDEILFRAFTSDHLALFGVPTPWLGPAIYALGIVTAVGTSFYMFRSYFMTFTGSYRGGAHPHEHNEDPHAATAAPHGPLSASVHASDGAAHAAEGEHGGPGASPHESPWTVTSVLVVLAAGSVLTLLLGLPALWTGSAPAFERWLEPVVAQVTFRQAGEGTEWLFQLLGVAAAAGGLAAAWALYRGGQSEVPARLKARFAAAWTVVYNKYYVDELYALAVVRPVVRLSALLFWVDAHLIDGLVNLVGALGRWASLLSDLIDRFFVDWAVNAVAWLFRAAGRSLRRVQTGHIQTYLYGALGGALVVVLLNFLIR
ncbi:MAG TPA: NADH-quinone oxidoreductase subunit L [Anaeromyxobacter sp.]|nr:NADH-quinone oxidoreductase subunit L [Anaeromyxobacter sp.]